MGQRLVPVGRRLVFAVCLVLLVTLLQAGACSGEGESRGTPGLLNIQIPVPEGTTASVEGSEYYLYAGEKGSIPYVMLRTYQGDDGAAFLEAFTEFMKGQYADLTVTQEICGKRIGDRDCHETGYRYKVSGYDVTDRRIVLVQDGTAYLFTSKEVEELGLTVGSLLEDVVANCVFLSEEEAQQESQLSDGYLYCLENGMPQYWLDFTGTLSDQLVLHICASTGDPATFERCLVLDLSAANVTQEGIWIRNVRDLEGRDLSSSFRSLLFQIYRDGILMTSELEEGGDTDIALPSGSFAMMPMRVASEAGKSHLRPASDGPYQAEELAAWARLYAMRTTGTYYEGSEAAENADGMFDITLYEDAAGTAPQDAPIRYTVDAYGEGTDARTGEPVSLMR